MVNYVKWHKLSELFARATCLARLRGDMDRAKILGRAADRYFDRYGLSQFYYHGF